MREKNILYLNFEPKKLNKSESKRYYYNSRIQNNRYRKFPPFMLPIYSQKLLVGVRLLLTFLVGSAVIKLTLLIWTKNLNKSDSKRYFCNSRIQNKMI